MIDWKPIMDALPDNDREVLCMLKDYPDPVMGGIFSMVNG